MSSRFEIDEVADRLWLGPCPRTPEQIAILSRDHGVTGLVSVQTDRDLEASGLTWSLMWRFLMARNIAATRVPVVDFEDASLVANLDAAVAAVASMHSAGRVTYVHCSIGMNRSPTVTIAWLVAHGGLDAAQAWDQVCARRPIVQPNRSAFDAWLAQRG